MLPVKFKQEEIARAANIINYNIKKTTQPRIRSFTENYPKKHVSPLHNYCPQQSLTSAQRLQFQREFIPLEYANEVKNYKLQQRADELAAALNPPKETQDPPTITPRVENKAVRNDSVASNSEQSQQIEQSAPAALQQPAPVPTQQPSQAPQAQAQGERVKPKRVAPSEHIAQMIQRADEHNSHLNTSSQNQNRGAR